MLTEDMIEKVARAIDLCPVCEGEGHIADGLDEAACSTDCPKCFGTGYSVEAAIRTLAPMVLDMAAKAVEDAAMILPAEECCVAHGDVCAGIIRNLKEQFNAR